MNESGVDMSPRRLSAADLQSALSKALRERKQLKGEIALLESTLAEKRSRLEELEVNSGWGRNGIIASLRSDWEKAICIENDSDSPSLVLVGDRAITDDYVIEKITPKFIFVRARGCADIFRVRKSDGKLFGFYDVDIEATEKVFKEFLLTKEKVSRLNQ